MIAAGRSKFKFSALSRSMAAGCTVASSLKEVTKQLRCDACHDHYKVIRPDLARNGFYSPKLLRNCNRHKGLSSRNLSAIQPYISFEKGSEVFVCVVGHTICGPCYTGTGRPCPAFECVDRFPRQRVMVEFLAQLVQDLELPEPCKNVRAGCPHKAWVGKIGVGHLKLCGTQVS